MTTRIALAALVGAGLTAGCTPDAPPRRYPLHGQVLAVDADRDQVTIRHQDIPGLMPAMTMSFPVASPALLDGLVAGDLVTGVLEVTDALGVMTELVTTGTAPLPTDINSLTLATGLLDIGDDLPDTALIDQDDRRRSLAEWQGTPTLMTFIYTRCPLPNFCPLMDQNFRMIQRAAREDPELDGRIRLISISFDPDHDTPAVLADHAASLGADPDVWTFLTGDRITVDRVAAKLGVGVIRGPDANAEITHNLRTILVGADGRIAEIYSGNEWIPSTVLADLRAAVRTP